MRYESKREKRLLALKLSLYVAGAGGFGVFLRWLQNQLAFNDLGLADPSAFHVILPLFVLSAGLVYFSFLDKMARARLSLPEALDEALSNDYRLIRPLPWVFGGIICLGALILFATTETDPYAPMQRALALLCLLSGIGLPLLLYQANRGAKSGLVPALLAIWPVLSNALWLVLSYRNNAINSTGWSYVLEMGTAIAGMFCFFRLAGFAFGIQDWKKTLLACMFAPVLYLMSLADERYFGMQVILLGYALMLMLCAWIMVENLHQGKPPAAAKAREDQPERLDIPVGLMRDFNRLPTKDECKAEEERLRREDEESDALLREEREKNRSLESKKS